MIVQMFRWRGGSAKPEPSHMACLLQVGKISLQSLALEGDEDADQLKELSDAELQDVNTEQLQYQRAVMEEQLKDMKPNMAAVEEYRRKVGDLDYKFSSL